MILNLEFSVTLDSPHLSPPYQVQPRSTYHPDSQGGEREDGNKREGEGIRSMFRRRMLSRVTLVAHLFLDQGGAGRGGVRIQKSPSKLLAPLQEVVWGLTCVHLLSTWLPSLFQQSYPWPS